MAKKIPDAGPLTGSESAIVFQDGKAVRTTVQAIASEAPAVVGPKGDPGPAGKDGTPGAAGKDGKDGKDGSPGLQGVPGKDGAAGRDGSPGIAGKDGAAGKDGLQGVAGNPGKDGKDGAPGAAGAPKRIERFSGATAATGIATISFSPAFEAVPDLDVIEDWSNEQMITGKVVPGSATKTGCQVQVMVSRGTLLLTTGPFQKAGAGVSVTVRAIGN